MAKITPHTNGPWFKPTDNTGNIFLIKKNKIKLKDTL